MNRNKITNLVSAFLFLCLSGTAANVAAQVSQRADRPAPWVGETLDGRRCTGGDSRGYGPFDYTIHQGELLARVDNNHFSSQVEQLIRGDTTRHPMGDVNYTLVRFPNHHRALYTAVRFSLGESSHGSLDSYPAECYLQRAIRFSPDDSVPHMLYGLYLHRLGQLDESLEKYEAAKALAPQDANLLYNMGLVYFEIGDYEKSHQHAVEAYTRGIELPGLRRRLQEAGHWE